MNVLLIEHNILLLGPCMFCFMCVKYKRKYEIIFPKTNKFHSRHSIHIKCVALVKFLFRAKQNRNLELLVKTGARQLREQLGLSL